MNKKQFYDKIDVTSVSEDDMRRINIMLDFVKDLKPKNLLDIGSMPQMTEIFADKLNCKTTGINISKKVVNSYKGKKIKFINSDIEKFKSKENFDLIICGELIEHLENVDEFIEKTKTMLNENGYLLLTIPNLASLFNRISLLFGWQPRGINPSRNMTFNPFAKYDYYWGHISMFTYSAMKKFLKENRFKILKTGGTHGGHVGENKIKSFIRCLMSAKTSFAEQVVILVRK